MEGHKKPIAEADTAKYYYVCLRRVACRRIARMQILLPIDFDMPVPEIADTTEWMREAINRLPHREQHVIALRFYSGGRKKPTYKTIGRQFGLSGERVRQLEVRALELLRVMLEEE